ncbi:MAG: AraC family transcriptional regulator [Burkholderiaceae bacterium]
MALTRSNREKRYSEADTPTPGRSDARQYAASSPIIDFDKRAYPAHKLAALVDSLNEIDVRATTLLSGSGLTEKELRSASAHISYRQMATLFRNALRLSPDPAFALRAGLRMRITAYGMYGYALMSSSSHKEGLELATKYHLVMGPVARMTHTANDDDLVFSYEPILSENPGDGLYRSCIEFIFSSHLTLNKDLYGSLFELSGISVKYPAPPYASKYRKVFGCPIEFGRQYNEIRFNKKWLDDPMPFSNPITNAYAREICEQLLLRADFVPSVVSRIRGFLIDHPGWFPRVEAMAAQLSMSSRKLHRLLEAEQTNYRQLLNEIRMELAIKYLRETRMSNEEIAARLGYSDASNFRHAFVRWTGKRPSDYRVQETPDSQ